MKKIISIFSLTIVALALFVFVKPVSAVTINVPASGSIQAAINTASAGDTINVAAGTYNESINITKPLTIEGAGPDSTILDSNSLYMVSVEANNVTIKDIAITSPLYNGSGDASGIVVSNAGSKSNLHITNVKIHDIGKPDRPAGDAGTQGINIGPVNGLEIDHSEIYNIIDNNVDSAALGITMWGWNLSDTANDINIHDNVIHDITNPVLAEGIAITSNTNNVTVNKNIVTGPFSYAGIYTSNNMVGPATITNNTVTGASAYGILLRSPFAQTVKGNTVSGATVGIQVNDTATVVPTINRNSISGNTAGLNNLSSKVVDATCNWWGSASGPGPVGLGSGDKVSTNVDFTPWLTTSNLNGHCNGPLVSPTSKDQCKKDGWQSLEDANSQPFKNQGQCVSYFNH